MLTFWRGCSCICVPLNRAGLIDVWNDTRLVAGDDWKHEVDLALASAAAAVLLVSADFLASDFIVDNELPPLLESAEAKGTRIIPVIVSHADTHATQRFVASRQ